MGLNFLGGGANLFVTYKNIYFLCAYKFIQVMWRHLEFIHFIITVHGVSATLAMRSTKKVHYDTKIFRFSGGTWGNLGGGGGWMGDYPCRGPRNLEETISIITTFVYNLSYIVYLNTCSLLCNIITFICFRSATWRRYTAELSIRELTEPLQIETPGMQMIIYDIMYFHQCNVFACWDHLWYNVFSSMQCFRMLGSSMI